MDCICNLKLISGLLRIADDLVFIEINREPREVRVLLMLCCELWEVKMRIKTTLEGVLLSLHHLEYSMWPSANRSKTKR